MIKPKSELIKGNYVPTPWASATLRLPVDVLVAFRFSLTKAWREKNSHSTTNKLSTMSLLLLASF